MALAVLDGIDVFSESTRLREFPRFPGKLETLSQAADTERAASVDLIKRRSAPDVIIMGHHDEILFASGTEGSPAAFLNSDREALKDEGSGEPLRTLLSGLRRAVLSRARLLLIEQSMEAPTVLFTSRGSTVSFRGLLLNGAGGASQLVMILIEKVKSSPRVSPTPSPSPHFTPRENSVLSCIKKGYTNKEIACALDIGVHTVKDHLKRIMNKVGVHTRAGIVGKLNVQ